MPYVLAKMEVRDFAEWEASFGSPESRTWRRAGGQRSYQIFRPVGQPNTVVVLIEWDNLDNAREHVQSTELQQIHEKLGVSGIEVYLLEEVERGSA